MTMATELPSENAAGATAPRPRLRGSLLGGLFLVVAVMALPLLLASIAQISHSIDREHAMVQSRVEARSLLVMRTLDQYVLQMRSAVDLVEAFGWPVVDDGDRADRRLETLVRSLPPIAHRLMLVSPEGRSLGRSGPGRDAARFTFEERAWFQQALASHDYVVSDPIASRIDGIIVVVFARAIRDGNGRAVGVAAASLDLQALSKVLSAQGSQTGTLASVISASGHIVARSEAADRMVGRFMGDRSEVLRVLAGGAGRGLVTTTDGIERVAAWRRSEVAPWAIFVGTPAELVRAAPLRAGLWELAALLATTLLALAGALVVGRRVTRPVAAVQDAARRVAAGDFGVRVDARERGELGDLQRDFNRMVERLEQSDRRHHESEARLRSLLRLSSDWYWEQDASLRFVDVRNSDDQPGLEKYASMSPRPGRWDMPFGGISEEERREFDDRLARHEPFDSFEFMRPDASGRMRWISISGEPVFDADGRFAGYRGIGRDVDRRRRAEEALRHSEARYRALLEGSGVVLWLCDAEGRFVEPQPGFEQYTGATWPDYQGQRWLEFVHPEDRERLVAQVYERTNGDGTLEHRARLWCARHDAYRLVRTQAVPLRDAVGRVVEWVGGSTDIHEQHLAEQAYLVSEERLSAATHAAGVGVFDIDVRDGRVFFSPALKAQLGYADAELPNDLTETCRHVHPDDLPSIKAAYEAFVAAPRGEFDAMGRFRHRDGSWRSIRARARMFADASGEAVRLLGATVDLTGEQRREVELAEERRYAEMALAAGHMVSWRWDLGEAPILWGENHEWIRGPLPAGRRAYPDFRDMVHPEDREAHVARARLAHANRSPYKSEHRVVWLDGSVHWIKSLGAWELDRDGIPVRLVGISQNITERVVTGERLRDSETRYRAVLETTTDTVVVIDGDSVITYVNPAVERDFGWKPEELTGMSLDVLQPAYLRAAHAEGVARALGQFGGERRRSFELTGLKRDGTEFPLEVSFSGLEHGGQRYFVGFLRDITRRKQSERELQESNEMLERRVAERTEALQVANRELESFSYTVAHDLRAPLRAIDGFSQLLEEEAGEALGPEARRHLGRIRCSTQSMGQMIGQLLEFSRIGRAPVALRPVDLGHLAGDLAESLAVDFPRAEVRLGTLPTVNGDATLLRVVLANLMGNALKFSSRREHPVVEVDALPLIDAFEIRVHDNGVGFDPAFASKLFGVFQRLHSREEFEGTGIGLATVARIVERHGGAVRAETRPGEGATFSFTIPR